MYCDYLKDDRPIDINVNREPTLGDTVDGMLSDDYKERFRAEFKQLSIRIDKLHAIVEAWDEGTLDFEPSCPYNVLHGQLCAMYAYKSYLRIRADIEGIEL